MGEPAKIPTSGTSTITEIDILWLTAGLGCDGDTIAMTGATQPSIEDSSRAPCPGFRRSISTIHFWRIEVGDEFVKPFRDAADGKSDRPFILVVEGSIPDETNKSEGYWASFRNRSARPVSPSPRATGSIVWLRTHGRSSRSAPALPTAAFTPWKAIPRAAWDLPDYLGWEWKSKLQIPIVCVPGCPVAARQHYGDVALSPLYGGRARAHDPARRCAAAHLVVWQHGARRMRSRWLLRAGSNLPMNTDRRLCIVKLGCWGPVVQCNVGKRGWMGGIGGCPNVGGICIGCTMPGFPDKFMPFMNQPPGSLLSSQAVANLRPCDSRSAPFYAGVSQQGAQLEKPAEIACTAIDAGGALETFRNESDPANARRARDVEQRSFRPPKRPCLLPTSATAILAGLANTYSKDHRAIRSGAIHQLFERVGHSSTAQRHNFPIRRPSTGRLLEQLPAVVFMAYLDRGIGEAYVSPQIEATLGFSQAEWLEDPVLWYRQIHPDDKDRWSQEAAEMFLSGKPLRSAYRVIARDGQVIWFHCEAKMILRPDGRPWFIQGVAFDISDLKRTEEELQEERNVVSTILDTVGALVLVLDREGRIVRFNRACEQLTGQSFEEARGKPVWDLFVVPEEKDAVSVSCSSRSANPAHAHRI